MLAALVPLPLGRRRGIQPLAAAPVGHTLGAAVDEFSGPAANVAACSWMQQ